MRPNIPKLSLTAIKKPEETISPLQIEQNGNATGVPKTNNLSPSLNYMSPKKQPQPQGWASQVASDEGGHSVYLLMPGVCITSKLSIADLKEQCKEMLACPSLEFFRISSISPLQDDAGPAPPGVLVAGCKINNEDFTLEYVEKTMKQNQALRDHVERAAEAVLTFQEKSCTDAETIKELKDQISQLLEENEDLHTQVAQLLLQLERKQRKTSDDAEGDESSAHHHHHLHQNTTRRHQHTETEAELSHRHHKRSSSKEHFKDQCKEEQPKRPLFVSNSSGSVPTSQLAGEHHHQHPVRPATSLSSSPRKSLHQRMECRVSSCICNQFQPAAFATWICQCGHTNLKHS